MSAARTLTRLDEPLRQLAKTHGLALPEAAPRVLAPAPPPSLPLEPVPAPLVVPMGPRTTVRERRWVCQTCRSDIPVAGSMGVAICPPCVEQKRSHEREALLVAAERQLPQSLRLPLHATKADVRKYLAERVRAKEAQLRSAWSLVLTPKRCLIYGPAGVGKSSLAAVVFTAFVRRHPRGDKALFVSAAKLQRQRQEHRFGEGEAPLVERALRASVLVIDNLGLGPPDLIGDRCVMDVLQDRFHQKKPTWVTTRMTGHELERRYGDKRVVAERALLVGLV